MRNICLCILFFLFFFKYFSCDSCTRGLHLRIYVYMHTKRIHIKICFIKLVFFTFAERHEYNILISTGFENTIKLVKYYQPSINMYIVYRNRMILWLLFVHSFHFGF